MDRVHGQQAMYHVRALLATEGDPTNDGTLVVQLAVVISLVLH